MKKLALSAALILAATAKADSATESLSELLRNAAGKNPEVQAARQRWEAARQGVPVAKAWDDPMLTLATQFPSSPATPSSMDGNLGYGLSQRIPFFGKKVLAGTIAEREAARLYEEYLSRLLEIAATLKGAYYDLYYTQKAIELNTENLRLLEQLTRVAFTRYGVGKAAQGDVLLAQIETLKLTTEIANLQRQRHNPIATINRLLGRAPTAAFGAAADIEPHQFTLDETTLYPLALERRPAINAARHDVARGDAAIKLAERNRRYPDVDIGAMVSHYTGDSGFRMAQIQVGIPLPWWNNQKYRADVRREQANRDAAALDLANLSNLTMEEIHHRVTDAQNAWRLIELYRDGVLAQSGLNVEANRATYQTGQTDFLTLLSAQRMLLTTHLDYHRAVAAYETALAEIEKMIGQRLEPAPATPQK